MNRLALICLALVSACAQPPEAAVPQAATLASAGATGDRLAVRFSDGATCRAIVPSTGGEGVFDACPQAQGYAVDVRHRNLLEPVFGAAVTPYATVTLTAASGRVTTFDLPTGGGR